MCACVDAVAAAAAAAAAATDDDDHDGRADLKERLTMSESEVCL